MFTRNCKQCGGEYKTKTKNEPQDYCSRKCRWDHDRTSIVRKCPVCQTEFLVYAYRLRKCSDIVCSKKCRTGRVYSDKWTKRKCKKCGEYFKCRIATKKKYCSKKCSGGNKRRKWISVLRNKTCQHCGKSYTVRPRDYPKSRYCSWKCRKLSAIISKTCAQCEEEFFVHKSESGRKFCSKSCHWKWQKDNTVRGDRIDANQPEIVSALKSVGVTVVSLASVKFGCPDLAVGFGGSTFLLEIKTENGKLSKFQKEWIPTWNGHVAIVKNPQEAYDAIGISASYMGGGSGILL